MKIKIILCGIAVTLFGTLKAQEVVHVEVYDKEREKAELNANDAYVDLFHKVLVSQQTALNYKRRMLIDNVFITEFQREGLNADMHISEEIIGLMEKNIQNLRKRIDDIWQYYETEFMGNPTIAPIIRTYYEAKKKQIFEDTELIDRKVDAFIKGKGVDNPIASPRQRMEIIREIRKEYQQLNGISLKQSSVFRMMVIGYMKQESESKN